MGVEVKVDGLTKSFGRQLIWADVSLTLPAGEISVLLGPSGTGKSVFLKALVGLLKPDRGEIWIEGRNLPRLSERALSRRRYRAIGDSHPGRHVRACRIVRDARAAKTDCVARRPIATIPGAFLDSSTVERPAVNR